MCVWIARVYCEAEGVVNMREAFLRENFYLAIVRCKVYV